MDTLNASSYQTSNVFNEENSIHQEFSIPSPIMHYVKKCFSWKVYTKLIKTCKHFYSKNDPVPINGICKHRLDKPSVIKPFGQRCSYKAFKKIKKYWISGSIFIGDVDVGISRKMFKKIYRCDIAHLRIDTHTLTFEEFKILASSKKLEYFRVLAPVRYLNGDRVTFGTIIEYLPNVKHLQYEDQDVVNSPQSLLKIINQLNNSIKNYPRWLQLDNTTHVWEYAIYLKDHPEVQYIFLFSNPHFDENCKELLDSNIVQPEYSWYHPLGNENLAGHFLEKHQLKKEHEIVTEDLQM